jgi:hypothetical protein
MTSKPMRTITLTLVLFLAGCGTPDPCAKDPASCQDAGQDSGGPDGPGSCVGVCAPHAPSGWFATSLLWVGPASATPPPCPDVMPAGFPGFADTAPTTNCPTCSCSPSLGAQCILPAQLSANPGACPGGSGAQQYDAPAGWDGICDATSPVSSVNSLTVTPPPNSFAHCNVVETGPSIIQGPTAAVQCDGMPSVAAGTCGDQSKVCTFPQSNGFLSCIIKSGDNACPDGWPTKHVVWTNDQACACQCGAPVGDSCSATVTVYKDDKCSQPLGSVMVSSDQPKGCVDVPPGSAFGSKSSTPPLYQAGTCTPSAFAEGASVTFCCLP